MEKTRIMAVAPYDGLRDLLLQVVKTRSDVDVSVFLGNLSKGVEHVQAMRNMGYSVILSRGETSLMLEKVADIPVIDIVVSGFDVLRSIRLAQSHSGPFVIVGHSSITDSARTLCELQQYDIDTFTVKSEDEADECLSRLKADGFTLVVGDTTTVNRARILGLGAILITSSAESVSLALDQAVKLDRQLSQSNMRESLYKNILGGISQNVAVFHSSGEVVFSNFSRDGDSSLELEGLKKYIPDVVTQGSMRVSLKKKNALWFVKASRLSHAESDYAIFCMDRSYDRHDRDLIKVLNYDEVIPDPIDLFYGAADISLNPLMKAEACGDYSRPILIRGEPGAGKEAIAKTIHLNSDYRDCPMVVIDGRLINDKKWDAEVNGKTSLMSLSGCTIYLKNIQSIPPDIQKKVGTCFVNTPLSRNNRLIFSHTDRSPFTVDNSFCEYLLGVLGCVTICIPPIRERKEDIPSLASLYIGDANQKFAGQVLGFEKSAIQTMLQFDWPTNTAQIKRVLNELLLLTRNSYISERDVVSVLENEKKFHNMSTPSIEIEGTLDDIVRSAIQSTLALENMNQSKAAKRLGISRGTLWKKLKQELA